MAEYDELVKRLKDAAYGDHERGCPARSSPVCTCGWNASAQMASEEAAAAIQALQQQGQWQDISTAPKDGTPILAFDSARGQMYVAHYVADMDFGFTSRGAWMFGEIGDPYLNDEVSCQPTHWRELPPPPTT